MADRAQLLWFTRQQSWIESVLPRFQAGCIMIGFTGGMQP